MKYATPLLGLAILMASVVAAAAAPQIPAQYHGEWCAISHSETQSIYRRCHDRYANEAGGISVRARYFDGLENRHTPTKIVPYRDGHKLQGMSHQGDTSPDSDYPFTTYWRLSKDGRLISQSNATETPE